MIIDKNLFSIGGLYNYLNAEDFGLILNTVNNTVSYVLYSITCVINNAVIIRICVVGIIVISASR